MYDVMIWPARGWSDLFSLPPQVYLERLLPGFQDGPLPGPPSQRQQPGRPDAHVDAEPGGEVGDPRVRRRQGRVRVVVGTAGEAYSRGLGVRHAADVLGLNNAPRAQDGDQSGLQLVEGDLLPRHEVVRPRAPEREPRRPGRRWRLSVVVPPGPRRQYRAEGVADEDPEGARQVEHVDPAADVLAGPDLEAGAEGPGGGVEGARDEGGRGARPRG